MGQTAHADELLEIARNKLRAIVSNDPRCDGECHLVGSGIDAAGDVQ